MAEWVGGSGSTTNGSGSGSHSKKPCLDSGDSMDGSENIPNIRYAIVRFRDSDESARLRLLLRQHGYEEPTWLDSYGQHLIPSAQPQLFNPITSVATSVIRSLSSARLDAALEGDSGGGGGGGSGSFLTLPTVLVDPTMSAMAPRSPRIITHHHIPPVSIALPLTSGRIPTPFSAPSRIASPSSSSRQSALGERQSSEMTTSDEPRASPIASSVPTPEPDVDGFTPEPLAPDIDRVSSAPAAAMMDDQPASGGGGISTAARAWVSPAPLRPRGKKPKPHEDPNVYYTCELCKNRILGTRVSNLQNHVRRHSTLKQFQCCYCEYAHNEIAKVRLHMTNNHKDTESAPVNNLTPDMQAVWRSLFRECFPTRAQRRRGVRATPHAQHDRLRGGAGSGSASSSATSSVKMDGVSDQAVASASEPSTSGTSSITKATSDRNRNPQIADDQSNPTSGSTSKASAIPLSLRRRRHHRRPPIRQYRHQPRSQLRKILTDRIRIDRSPRVGGLDDDHHHRSTKRGGDDARIISQAAYCVRYRLYAHQRFLPYWPRMGVKKRGGGGRTIIEKKRHPQQPTINHWRTAQCWRSVGG